MDKDIKTMNVFSSRNFQLLFLEGLISEIGYALYSFAVSFYILELSGNNAFIQGLFVGVCSAAMLIAMPFGGVLGDRNSKVRIMTACDLIRGALLMAAAVFMIVTKDQKANLIVLFAVGIAGNILTGIFGPASSGLLPYVVDEDRLQQATSYTTIRSSLTAIIGVAVAGVLYAALPLPVLFLIMGVCYIISGISVMFIRCEEQVSEDRLTLKLFFSDMKDGLDYLRTQKALMILMAAVVFINFFFVPIGSNFMPYFIKTDIGGADSYLFDDLITPEMWSSVFSMLMGVSALVSSVILSAGKQREKCGRSTAKTLGMIGVFMMALTAAYWVLVGRGVSLNAFIIFMCIGCVFLDAAIIFINIPISTVLMRVVDRDKLSKVSSITSTISQCMVPVSSVIAGIVLQKLGITPLLIMCAAGFSATAVMLMRSREIDDI